jgi:hypothetical protein
MECSTQEFSTKVAMPVIISAGKPESHEKLSLNDSQPKCAANETINIGKNTRKPAAAANQTPINALKTYFHSRKFCKKSNIFLNFKVRNYYIFYNNVIFLPEKMYFCRQIILFNNIKR